MKNDEYLLSFEQDDHKDVLNIHTDLSGLEHLIGELMVLLRSAEKGKNDHTHLMTEEYGGYELSSENKGGEIINHVKIYCWNEK